MQPCNGLAAGWLNLSFCRDMPHHARRRRKRREGEPDITWAVISTSSLSGAARSVMVATEMTTWTPDALVSPVANQWTRSVDHW